MRMMALRQYMFAHSLIIHESNFHLRALNPAEIIVSGDGAQTWGEKAYN